MKENKLQNGNVLFLILIAIFLFAALSYAVTSSSRGGGTSISKDKARANAAAIIQYGTVLRSAVMRMKLSNGCADDTMDFSNNIYQQNDSGLTNSANSNAPADKRCHVFEPEGGGIAPVILSPESLDMNSVSVATPGYFKLGHGGVRIFQIKSIGTDGPANTPSANDIVFWQHYLNRETCLAINDLLGVTNPGGNPPSTSMTGSAASYVNGSFSSNGILDIPTQSSQPTFCWGPSANYRFIQVLVER